ncbi:MAG TPA: hypothetical protein VJQ56_07025, partial [Blastocatellia bacterium]|nr:hypothetical protein [Blastocatellia bacterium]
MTKSASLLANLAGAVIFLVLNIVAAHAQVGLTNAHPNLSRGNGDDKTAERYELDSVNLFNGNLSLSIPLGARYPLARDFGYSFALNYNSNVWDIESSGSVVSAAPIKNSNAGFGWDLGFGRLIPPQASGTQVGRWVYVSPDGAYHPFYSTLHQDVSENDPDDTYLYTRDGSCYRLYVLSATQRFVEAPDGTQSLFELVGGGWRLKQIGDRFTNRLWFTYGTNVLTLSDNHGRTHRIHFKPNTTGTYASLVDRVELAAFNGTTATYALTYRTDTVSRPSVDNDPATAATVSLPVLVAVTLPDGSRYNFNYHNQATQNSSGRIAGMQLPTLGSINWTYTNYSFTGGGRPTGLAPGCRSNVGVGTRSLENAADVALGRWTYQTALTPSGQEEREMTNTVITPAGDKHVYYFNVNTTSTTGAWRRAGYGLPGTHNQYDSSGTRALTWQVLDCNSSGSTCQTLRS